ncbi:MAG: repeat protein [Herbaspirillum sp.]|nr:repeat protein [Herbaspirillum sp.]
MKIPADISKVISVFSDSHSCESEKSTLPLKGARNDPSVNFYSRHMKHLTMIAQSDGGRINEAIRHIGSEESGLEHSVLRWGNELHMLSSDSGGENVFQTVFHHGIGDEADMWILPHSFRQKEGRQFFAGDVSRFHFLIDTVLTGKTAHLPRTIKMEAVMNEETIKNTAGLSSGSEALRTTFMTETPIGRSTARMLRALNAEVTSIRVERDDRLPEYANFFITIAPRPRRMTLGNATSFFIQKYQPALQSSENPLDFLPDQQTIVLPGRSGDAVGLEANNAPAAFNPFMSSLANRFRGGSNPALPKDVKENIGVAVNRWMPIKPT